MSTAEPTVGLTNTRERYGRVAQAFHWTIAVLFLAQYPLGGIAHRLPRETSEQVALVATMFSWHKTIGVVVFVLALGRITWALANPHPVLLNAEKRGEAFAAATIHWVLYAAILLIPLTGMTIHWSTTGFAPLYVPFPNTLPFIPTSESVAETAVLLHSVLGKVVLAAIALHVAGALKHHFVDKDATLVRMLPWRAPRLPELSATEGPRKSATMGAAWGGLALVAVVVLGTGATLAPEREVVAAVSTEEATPAATTGADAWIVDREASTLGLTIQQLGSPVTGEFASWSGDIRFDPEAPEAASIDVTVDLGSLTLGTVADQAKGPDFLAVETSPTARYTASGFEPLGEGRYRADGTLTLRDVEKPVPLEFDLAIDGDTATANGTASLNRLDFEVGAEGYPDESSVGFGVDIDVTVTATRAGADAAPGS